MRRINNADIKFPLAEVKGLTENFKFRFYTTNEEFCLEYDQNDVYFEGIIPYLKLNWNDLQNIGRGVMNYILFTYQNDQDFDDGVFDTSYSRTTDYFIDTNIVIEDEEDTETISQKLTELDGKVDELESTTNEIERVTAEALNDLNSKNAQLREEFEYERDQRKIDDNALENAINTKQDKLTNGYVAKIIDEEAGSSGTLHKLHLVTDWDENIDIIATSHDPFSTWAQGDDQSLATIGLIKQNVYTKAEIDALLQQIRSLIN